MRKFITRYFLLFISIVIALSISVSAYGDGVTFYDVSQDSWYYDPILWAVENGITNGTSDTSFSPDDTCTTAQIITFLWRAAGSPEVYSANPFFDVASGAYYEKAAIWAYDNGLTGGNFFYADSPCTRSSTVYYLWMLSGSPQRDTTSPFSDVDSYDDFAQAVIWAVDNGITNGTSSSEFSPYSTCTRGQIVTFLYRWCGIAEVSHRGASDDNTWDTAYDSTVEDSEPIDTWNDVSNGSEVTVPPKSENTERLVWIPVNGGEKYHNNNECSNMIDPIQVSVETAIAEGYTACKKCY